MPLLLLLPLGAAVVVFMRVMIGLQTAGTFMPILISLAFLQTSLLPGLISFISVVGIGLALRSYLSRLNLLLVARIATLIVLVIFVISMILTPADPQSLLWMAGSLTPLYFLGIALCKFFPKREERPFSEPEGFRSPRADQTTLPATTTPSTEFSFRKRGVSAARNVPGMVVSST